MKRFSWRDLSISKKLYTVVGIMGVLILGELLTLSFSMRTLSGARAFVAGESLWSKAQKTAVISLERYSASHDETEFDEFLKSLKVPEGDHIARLELSKKDPDFETIRRGFIQGQIPDGDIPPMVDLIRRFYWTSYLSRAIEIWGRGDTLLGQLKEAGIRYRSAVRSGDRTAVAQAVREIREQDVLLTDVENSFSFTLGEGSRWMEQTVFSVLFMLVFTVEGVGLTLTFFTSRALSRGLKELEAAAVRIGQGDFAYEVKVSSHDEIGKLASAIDGMGDLLERSYGVLEQRVNERTRELAELAQENAGLYEDAKRAIQMRDEFLSIASHELKTPVTALLLELQLLTRVSGEARTDSGQKVVELSQRAARNSKRLSALLDELLDLTRIQMGKLELHYKEGDLAALVREVVAGFTVEAAKERVELRVQAGVNVIAEFDSLRVAQILSNLISNAIKYAPGGPVVIDVSRQDGLALLTVSDQGPGIPADQRERIFERLERLERDTHQRGIGGLGLGLYIARQLAQAHRGRIYVEDGHARGAKFVVELPVAASSALKQGRG